MEFMAPKSGSSLFYYASRFEMYACHRALSSDPLRQMMQAVILLGVEKFNNIRKASRSY